MLKKWSKNQKFKNSKFQKFQKIEKIEKKITRITNMQKFAKKKRQNLSEKLDFFNALRICRLCQFGKLFWSDDSVWSRFLLRNHCRVQTSPIVLPGMTEDLLLSLFFVLPKLCRWQRSRSWLMCPWLKERSLQRHLHLNTPHCQVSCGLVCSDRFLLTWTMYACTRFCGCWFNTVQLSVCWSGHRSQGCIAQWLEQLTADQQVLGSIPGGGHGLLSWQDPTIWRIQRIRWSTAWARLQ